MTFPPVKLESWSDSLDAEVKSAEMLLSRLASLAPGEDGEGGAGAEAGAGARAERAKKAGGVVRAYVSWLADPSKEFGVELDDSRGDASDGDVSFPSALPIITPHTGEAC